MRGVRGWVRGEGWRECTDTPSTHTLHQELGADHVALVVLVLQTRFVGKGNGLLHFFLAPRFEHLVMT